MLKSDWDQTWFIDIMYTELLHVFMRSTVTNEGQRLQMNVKDHVKL